MKGLKKHFLGISLLVALLFGANVALPAYAADFQDDACTGLSQLNSDKASTDCGGGAAGVKKFIGNVVNILSIIIGAAAVIMIIVGGLRYVTSGGDSNAVSSAKNTVIYALVGLVVAVLAQFLVHFVVLQVSGATCPTNNAISAKDKSCKP